MDDKIDKVERLSSIFGALGLVSSTGHSEMPSNDLQHRPCSASASSRDDIKCFIANKLVLSVVVLGASGDLAKKKTFPALFTLFKKG